MVKDHTQKTENEYHLLKFVFLSSKTCLSYLPCAVAPVVVHLLLVLEGRPARLTHQRLQLRLSPLQLLQAGSVLAARLQLPPGLPPSRRLEEGRAALGVHRRAARFQLLVAASPGAGFGFGGVPGSERGQSCRQLRCGVLARHVVQHRRSGRQFLAAHNARQGNLRAFLATPRTGRRRGRRASLLLIRLFGDLPSSPPR